MLSMKQINIGEPTDVKNAKKWDELDTDRYLISKSEAKASTTKSAEDNYKIALENELMKMNTLLNNVDDKDLDTYDSEKLKDYLQALENFSNNEKISETNGSLINDTFYVDIKNNIDRIREKYADKLSDDQNTQLDKIEENSGNNSQNDYKQWLDDQKNSEEDSSNADIWDGGKAAYKEVTGGMIFDAVFDIGLLVGDSINATFQKIMYADEKKDGGGLISNILSVIGDTFNIMSEDSSDSVFENGGDVNESISVEIYQQLNSLEFPHIHYSCEEIFSGKVGILNINFISGEGQADSLGIVREVVSGWYKALRMIAIVGMLSSLIYTGIRMIITSTANEKAKYKEWLINWIVGFALLFVLHYIMSFITTAIDKINDLLGSTMQYINVSYMANKLSPSNNKSGEFSTNLIGLVRFLAQSSVSDFKMGYLIIYWFLITATIKFTIVYLKRLVNMAFLTLIAPIIAFTYPLDKMADGQAQGFNAWLKEYVYNALLQPMHFILYYSLVGASIKIAAVNPLYAIAVLTFMSEGEKLLKKILGFDRAKGLGTVKGMQDAIVGATLGGGVAGLLTKAKGSVNKVEAPEPGVVNNDYQNVGLDMGSSGDIPDQNNNVSENQNSIDISNNESKNNSSNQNKNTTQKIPRPPKRTTPPVLENIEPMSKRKSTPIHELAKKMKDSDISKKIINGGKNKVVRGGKSVLRKIVKPVWNTEKTAGWNAKRLTRKVARGAVGTAVGITAAAIQAGISLTDGKYNPLEGVTAFGAGFTFAGNKAEGLVNTFDEGYNDYLLDKDLSAEDKKIKLRKYQEQFKNRDDVIKFCKENYGNDWKKYRDRMAETFVSRGITDLSEMKEMIKYSKKTTQEIIGDRKLTDEEKEQIEYQQDVTAIAIKEIMKKKKKEGTFKSVYDTDAEDREILAKTAGMKKDDAEKVAKKIRDDNSVIRYYYEKIN